ncbi:MAG: hypothetical protein KDN19_12845 [Verrucomicrobiae bacterium]|nr:hypothetical protein [Verrucomicrobiae bacterium]
MTAILGAVGFGTLLLMVVMIGGTVAVERYENLPGMMGMALLVGSGILLLMFLVSLVVFRGKMRMRVEVDDEKIIQTVISRSAGLASGAALVAGLTGGGATLAGSGLIAAANRTAIVKIRDLTDALGNSKTGEIRLLNDWRMVMQLFVPLDRYDEILAALQARIETGSKPRERTDIPPLLKLPVVMGTLLFGGLLMVEFPLGFSRAFVVAMGLLTLVGILGRPQGRRLLGWLQVAVIVGGLTHAWTTAPPAGDRVGEGWAVGIQLALLGLFAIYGLLAGLGKFQPSQPVPGREKAEAVSTINHQLI